MPSTPPSDFWTWIGPTLLLMLGFFLKGLHSKIEKAVTKEDFHAAVKRLEDEKVKAITDLEAKIEKDFTEVKSEHEKERNELRNEQSKLYAKLDFQQQLLTQVATQVNMILEMMRKDK